MKISNSTLKL